MPFRSSRRRLVKLVKSQSYRPASETGYHVFQCANSLTCQNCRSHQTAIWTCEHQPSSSGLQRTRPTLQTFVSDDPRPSLRAIGRSVLRLPQAGVDVMRQRRRLSLGRPTVPHIRRPIVQNGGHLLSYDTTRRTLLFTRGTSRRHIRTRRTIVKSGGPLLSFGTTRLTRRTFAH